MRPSTSVFKLSGRILPKFLWKSLLARATRLSRASWGMSLSHCSLPLPSSQIVLRFAWLSIQAVKGMVTFKFSVGVETFPPVSEKAFFSSSETPSLATFDMSLR